MTTKRFLLTSSDGVPFEIEEAVALKSQTLTHILEDNDVNNELHLPRITAKILARVIEYCKKHVDAENYADAYGSCSSSKEELKNWDAIFMELVDDSTLLELNTAANFLKIKSLVDLTCQRAADLLQDKTVDEIPTFSNIKKLEEVEKIRQENQWAFE